MRSDRIRIRNLDDEVLRFFRNIDEKITYDALDSTIIEEIKNGEGTNKYNDSELRSRIISLERNKLASIDAESIYLKRADAYNRQEIDQFNEELNNAIDGKLDALSAKTVFLENKNGVITENLLSSDLINKVNARYENKRPESGGSGEVTLSDFNLLKVQVNNNTTAISTLNEYVNQNVLTVNDKIGISGLDSEVAEVISKARINTVPIELNDLSEDIQNKLNNTVSGSFDTLETNINNNASKIAELNSNITLRHGEILIGAMKNSDADEALNLQHSYILPDNVIIAASPELLTEVMEVAEAGEIQNVIDIENNILYSFIDSTWVESTEYAAASEYMAGKFALEYGTGNLYFGYSPEEIDVVINIGELTKRTELDNYLTTQAATAKFSSKTDLDLFNTTVNELTTKNTDLEGRIAALETSLLELSEKNTTLETSITDLSAKNTTLEEQLASLQVEVETIKTKLETIQGEVAT